MPWALPHPASTASLGALPAPGQPSTPHKIQKTFIAADSLPRPGKLSVEGSQPQRVLQPFLASSQGSAGLRRVVAGSGVLRVFWEVITDPALVHELNLHELCKTTGHAF